MSSTDLQFLARTPTHLMIHDPVQYLSGVTMIFVPFGIFIAALLFFLVRRVNSSLKASLALALPGLLISISTLAASSFSHTLDLSRDRQLATYITGFAGITFSKKTYPLQDLHRCVLEFGRGVPRIAVVMANGNTTYPLGTSFDPRPSVYQVQEALNQFLGGTAEQ